VTTGAESLRLILGLRVRGLREERGWTLKQFSQRCGLSISYLSEIEQGRKYPKPEKLLALSAGLNITYDELVASSGGDGQQPIEALLRSPLIGGFPFEVFGVRPEDVVRLLTEAPDRARALARAFVDLGRTYDLRLEDVLLSALRSYQEMHHNYFEDLESAASEFRARRGYSGRQIPAGDELRSALTGEFAVTVDEQRLATAGPLAGLRSVYLEGKPARLLIHPHLLPSQRAFVLARELGYRVLHLKERALTSSWIEVDSFEQVLNNFKASYFAGALLLDREVLRSDLEIFFARPRFRAGDLLALLKTYEVTAELFFHRLTELLPHFFGLEHLFFLRLSQGGPREAPRLTKYLNLSTSSVPYKVGGAEHYCARWPGLRALDELAVRPSGPAARPARRTPTVVIGRSRFVAQDARFLSLAVARPLALHPEGASSVELGLLDDARLREVVRFAADPSLELTEVGLTCERCPLAKQECAERRAPASLWRRELDLDAKRRALAELQVRA
jgi:transcriptional regulator with XRE-family HTH domain